MLEKVEIYLAYQGFKYIKPEKAGEMSEEMKRTRLLAQEARKEFGQLGRELEKRIAPFQMEQVSQWMNQAQICRPHFLVYYRLPSDARDDVALAIRLYGQSEDWGIAVEVSFVERKKSETSLSKQNQVLEIPVQEGIYYWVQKDGVSERVEATEANRRLLQEQVRTGLVRKVLVKTDFPLQVDRSREKVVLQLASMFHRLLPYYEASKKTD
ncbi:ribonuclease P [Streptococcus ovuberis]|uniref:Ribonuclease P n=1 Tax=Streptococcus ovuberis TaxID=1936207 RepID=A0A7X6S0V9_9STRE|nr:ribonuclease P [Streptococcus ovuberis]NKZ19531.1 ribonuclease P [Streptococcus ovuberis]